MNDKPNVTPTIRRNELMKLKLDGATKTVMWDWWSQTYEKTLHSFEKDITWVNKKISLFVTREADKIINDHLIRYDRNDAMAIEMGNVDASTRALIAKERLLKMHVPDQQVLIQQNTVNVEALDVHQIKELLERYDKDE